MEKKIGTAKGLNTTRDYNINGKRMSTYANINFFGKLLHYTSDGNPSAVLPDLLEMKVKMNKYLKKGLTESEAATLAVESIVDDYVVHRGFFAAERDTDFNYYINNERILIKHYNKPLTEATWNDILRLVQQKKVRGTNK